MPNFRFPHQRVWRTACKETGKTTFFGSFLGGCEQTIYNLPPPPHTQITFNGIDAHTNGTNIPNIRFPHRRVWRTACRQKRKKNSFGRLGGRKCPIFELQKINLNTNNPHTNGNYMPNFRSVHPKV